MSSKTTTDSSAADQLWVFTHNGGRVRGDQLVALSIEERSYEPGEPRVAIMGRVAYDPDLRVILARFDTEAEARNCLDKILQLLAHDRRGYGVLEVGRQTGSVSIRRPKPQKPDEDDHAAS